MNKKNVLIVGGGPTGVSLACLLIKQGIECRVVEKRPHPTNQSKAINVSAATLQMFSKLGVADRFLANGIKVEHVYVHWENNRIVHINYSLVDSPFGFFLSLPQAKTERILAEYLEELGGKVERNIECVDANVLTDGVEVTLKGPDGTLEKSQYGYVIACDGAKSGVRNALGVPFVGHDFHKHYYLFDAYIDWKGPITSTHYYVRKNGYFIVAPMVGGYNRMVLYDESQGKRPLTKIEEYQELIDLYGPPGITLKEMIWNSTGFFYNRLIDNFRYKKRLFFAGDAAHIFSPLGGHGMNSCFGDVDNLSWKLAGVINEGWDDQILDTYNEERKFVAGRLIKATDTSTRLINCMEHEITSDLKYWCPLLLNRENLRKRYPHQFSGLALKYLPSDFVHSNQEDPSEETIVGSFLPYVDTLEINNMRQTSYQLCKKKPVVLIFGRCDEELATTLSPFGFQLYSVVDEAQTSECATIVDLKGKLRRKCGVSDGDILLLRPDSIIGIKEHRSNLEGLKKLLDKWYTPHAVLVG